MFYEYLGRIVWRALRVYLRQRYGSTSAPKPLLAGVIVGLAVALSLGFQRARGSSS
jgi:hypothetical protein